MLFALHLPDHTLSPTVTIGATLVAAFIAAGCGLVRLPNRSRTAGPSIASFAAVVGLVLAVQAVNFPLPGGVTSGHVLGSTAACVLLGPAYGAAAMVAALAVQAIVFADGGLAVFGANVLNMVVVAGGASLVAYRAVLGERNTSTARAVAALFAGWIGSTAAAAACAAELACSGVGSVPDVFASLVGHHALLGIVEGAFTALAATIAAREVGGTWKVRPATIAALAAAAALLLPASSSLPDGLEATLARAEVRR